MSPETTAGTARLRVLVISPDFPPARGGIQLLVHRVVQHWTSLEASIVTLSTRGSREFDRHQGFRVHRVGSARLLHHTAAVALLNGVALLEARRFRPAAILSAHIVTSPAAWAIGQMTGKPFVQYLHANEVAERPHLARFAVRRARAVLAVSRYTAGLARASGADAGKIHQIAPGVDLPMTCRSRRSSRPTVITIARLADRYKGHDVLIDALPIIRNQVPDVLWVVIGDGPLRRSYERLVQKRGLADHVRFLGAIDDAERELWLDRAHVLAMPSRLPARGGGEGFGIVYLEAGVHGVPVVAGNVGGAVDAVLDGETGLHADPTDPVAVAAAITRLLLHPKEAQALGRAGARRARGFAWPVIARQVEDVMRQVAASEP